MPQNGHIIVIRASKLHFRRLKHEIAKSKYWHNSVNSYRLVSVHYGGGGGGGSVQTRGLFISLHGLLYGKRTDEYNKIVHGQINCII